MFDILSEMFARPGNMFSSLPIWYWNGHLTEEELVRQLDGFHKKGIDGCIICPTEEMDVEGGFLGEAYLEMVRSCLEAAKKRRMLTVFHDAAFLGSAWGTAADANPLLAARKLYARPTGGYTPAPGEEPQMRMALQFDSAGKLTDVITDTATVPEDYVWYDFILGFADPAGQKGIPVTDLLNPETTDAVIASVYEGYYRAFGEEFGQTVIGFYTEPPTLALREGEEGILWTYDFHECFGEAGGDAKMLASLLFPPAEKRWAKDGQYYYQEALGRRMQEACLAPLADWCARHKTALMGHPAHSHGIGLSGTFDLPGQKLSPDTVTPETALTSLHSVSAKCSADAARLRGLSRNLCQISLQDSRGEAIRKLSAAEMMWYLNFLFARGVNMIVPQGFLYSSVPEGQTETASVGPDSIWWDQQKPLSGYIKRLSWLNTNNTNNPHAAVLCGEDILPTAAVKPLFEMGYTFHYLTMDQLEQAHIHEGRIRVDRYAYDTLLIDSRLRLTPSLVKKIGAFVTQGGKMHRASEFGDFMKKNSKKTSFFDGQNADIRFVHLTKSGYPFFLLCNEGDTWARGHLVTDLSGACRRFDPFTGKNETVYGEICDEGLRYPVEIAPWSAVILGLNTDVLPELGTNPAEVLSEIVSLSETRHSFSYTPGENKRVWLCCEELRDRMDAEVNSQPAGTLLYKPYRLEITALLREGENTVTWTVAGTAANTGIRGVRVEILDRKA